MYPSTYVSEAVCLVLLWQKGQNFCQNELHFRVCVQMCIEWVIGVIHYCEYKVCNGSIVHV